MNDAGIIVSIIGAAVTVLGVIVGIAWRAGVFKAGTEGADVAATAMLHELRLQMQHLASRVDSLVVQGVKNEQDIRNLQELRREMLATLDKIFDSLSRGQRP